MTKTEAIAWLEVMKEDAIFEQNDALKMAIEALQAAEINCVHCPRYYETEDDIDVHSHCGSHGRLIDADALMEYCESQKNKTISNNDIARFPSLTNVVSEDTQTETRLAHIEARLDNIEKRLQGLANDVLINQSRTR